MKTKHLICPAIALGLTAATSQAATIVYDFEGGDVAQANNISVTAVGNSSNDFGSGITISNWNVASPSREVFVSGGQVRAKKSGDTDTHTFTVTIPDLGSNSVTFTNFSFDFGEAGPDDGAPTWTVSSDFGGGVFTPNFANGTGTGSANDEDVSMALTGFTGISNTTITFTLGDAAGGNNSGASMYTYIDNVVLTGEVVPEPSTTALLGLGGLALILRRRKG